MPSLIIGIILLILGIALTVSSPHSIYYGAIVVGIINIIRGIWQLTQARDHYDDHY